MFCDKCGKEISDQAQFCNYCGTPVKNAQAQPAPQPTSQPAKNSTQSNTKKKGGTGRTILSVILVVAVFFTVRYVVSEFIFGSKNESPWEKGFNQALTDAPGVTEAMSSCMRGSIYENGYLRYGMTRLNMPGYSVYSAEDRDYLLSADETILFTAYKQFEIMDISYDYSDEEGLLDSFKDSYADVSMISFQKSHINNFPVIRYIVSYTLDGMQQYQGELIVFPRETTNETIRLTVFADAEYGATVADINRIFDTLEVSPDFRVTTDDTTSLSMTRITVK